MKIHWAYILLLPAAIFFRCNPENSEPVQGESPDSALFTLLDPQVTNVVFTNALDEGVNTNILMYEYFYNGGGVAAGDVNGDGMIDLYFSSNMHENKLFLNVGGMKFRDVTKSAGISCRNGPWKTGITLADVNGDNRSDVYVCYSGMVRDENRKNELYINIGNDADNIPRFEEKAATYGLDSKAFSNQGYFFDFDRDQDLDLLLLNHNPVNLPILNEANTAALLKKDDPLRGVRLFRQTNQYFEDITPATGINGSELTYGLGAGIADINNDGWPDIYLSNDYAVPDYLYINNRDGTFTNRLQDYLGHTSQFSMGNDVADINNDGHFEIVTLDMLPEDNHRQKLLMSPDNYAKFDLNVRSGFHYQYMRNMLHLNNGNNTFSEIGQLSQISNTDWSWAALLADYDNDGLKDLLVTNGYVRDYTNLDFIKYMDNFVKSKGRLRREEVLEIIRHMPSSNISNYIFSNNDGLRFTNQTSAWGMKLPSNSNGAAYADLDNDGDQDIIVNNINQPAFIFRNNAEKNKHHFLKITLAGEGMNTQGTGARVSVWNNGKSQHLEQMPSRGYLSTVTPVLHFGLGQQASVDSLTIRWPSGKTQSIVNVQADQLIVLKELDGKRKQVSKQQSGKVFQAVKPSFDQEIPSLQINDFKRQPLLLNQLSYGGPRLIKADINNDGLEDVYVSGGNGIPAKLYLQRRNKAFFAKTCGSFEDDRNYIDADAAFLDANGDGFIDLYVATGGYHNLEPGSPMLQDRLYLNDTKGEFIKSNSLPNVIGSKGCIAVSDYNADGHPDIFIGGRSVPGRYPEIPESFLLINDGKGNFTNRIEEIAPSLKKAGMITDAIWFDINHDSKQDLIVTGEWMAISVFLNSNDKLENRTTEYFSKTFHGWWNSIDTADVNNDQIPEIIAGNYGLNSQCKVSADQPAELFFKDFDANGSVDPLFCFYVQGRSYPYVTRDELLEQIGKLRSRFTDYKSYADAVLTDIFDENELGTAKRLHVDHLETTLFIKNSGGKYQPTPLPLEAQFSPVHATETLDFNNDGNLDLLLCGNNSYSKIKIGKSDANYGVLLRGNGRGEFEYVPQSMSGLILKGDVRSVIKIHDTFYFGITQKPLTAYRLGKGRDAQAFITGVD